MRTGTAFASSSVLSALLLASVVTTAGCDAPIASSPPRLAGDASLLGPSDSGRQRNDPAGSRFWILNRDGVFLYSVGTGKLVEITLPGWQWIDEPYACLPDLAIGPNGEAVITSNVVPVLWRVDPQTLTVTVHPLALDADHMKDVGFSGLVYSAEYGAYFAVSDLHNSLWRLDRSLEEGKKVAQLLPVRDRCSVALPRSGE